jgi:hypothetical protein
MHAWIKDVFIAAMYSFLNALTYHSLGLAEMSICMAWHGMAWHGMSVRSD